MFSKNIEDRLIYEYIRGSHCHGINTPTSDVDMGGVFVTPMEELVSLYPESDIYEDSTHDCVAYELGKYCRLLLKANPTMLESLFVDDKFVVRQHPVFSLLKDARDNFVTQDCFNSFTGYAYSQISKARGLNKKICNPVEKRLTPMDFCYTFHKGGSIPMAEFLRLNKYEQERCGLVAIDHIHDAYAVYYCTDEANAFRGIVSPDGDEVRLTSVPKGMKPICYMSYNKSGYSLHCKEYKEYQDWVKKRNPVRYESNLDKNYDAKNMCECFRLLRMGVEIAMGEGVIVNREGRDAQFLLDVKAHKYEYEELMKMLEAEFAEMKKYMEVTKLPRHADEKLMDGILRRMRNELQQA